MIESSSNAPKPDFMRFSNPHLYKKLRLFIFVGMALDFLEIAISVFIWYTHADESLKAITTSSRLLGLISLILYRQVCYHLCDYKDRNQNFALLVWVLGPFAILLIAKMKDGPKRLAFTSP